MMNEMTFKLISYDTEGFEKEKWLQKWEDAWPIIHSAYPRINSISEYFETAGKENQLFNPEEQIQAGFKKIFLLVPEV